MFPPHTPDRFKIESQVGGGGMGEVYRATDLDTGQTVAVKLLGKKATASDRQRFLREIDVLADLRHPGIVTYIDHGEWPRHRLYLAMEWLEGEDLSQRQRRKPLGMSDAVEVVRRAAQGMAAIHARGVVHRDLKLSNIFIVQHSLSRGVKLIDFGVVKLPTPDEYPTQPGTIIGTPHFMAPEQAQGLPVDARADVYALGAVLFRLVTGRFAFESEHIVTYLARIVLEEPPRASSVRFDVPEELDALLAGALARSPEHRPEDAGDLARRLARLPSMTNDPPNADQSRSIVRRVPPHLMADAEPLPRFSTRPPGRPGDQERRVVAVVLCAIPMPGMPASTSAKVRAVIGEDARLESLQGGQSVAAIGITQTQGDEAVRAARAALIIATSVSEARVAVATGYAVTGRRGITGEALERAADQLERAAAGSIRIDKATCSLLEGRFVIRYDNHGAALLQEDFVAVGTRRLLGRTTPTVGRDAEIKLLIDAFQRTAERGSPCAIVVSGPAGIGKSRLRYEVIRRLTQELPTPDVVMARGDPMLAHTGLSALGRALRHRIGIRDGEPLTVQTERTLRYVEQRPGCPEGIAGFIGELVGAPFDDLESEQLRAARESPQLMAIRISHAVEAILQHDSPLSPQVLVLEDLHAMDEATIQTVDWLLGSTSMRFVVLAFGRPELTTRFPELWRERKVTRIELGLLSAEACEKIVASVPLALDEERRKNIIERAEGNALFLEELLRHAAEGLDELPVSVQAVVQLRLDKLPPDQRAAARAAAVFGRHCWTNGVSVLLERDCQADIEALAQAEILVKQTTSRIAGQTEWMFANAVVQETAYSALLPEDRVALHRAASRWLTGTGEDDPAMIARHAEAGDDRERAAVLYGRAAARAYANGQLVVALEFAERSLACGDDPALRARAMLQKAQVLSWLGRCEAQLEAAESAVTYAEPGTDLWGEAHRLAGSALRDVGRPADAETRLLWALDHPFANKLSLATRSRLYSERVRPLTETGRALEARDIVDTAISIAEQAGETGTNAMLRALDARFMAISYLGDFSGSIRAARVVAERADAAGDVMLAMRARVNLGSVLNRTGLFEEAKCALDRALTDARSSRTKVLEGFALLNLGMSLARLDRLDEGIQLEHEALRIGRETSSLKLKIATLNYEALFRTWRGAPGDLSAALAITEEARAAASGHPVHVIEIMGTRAQVQLARREHDAAVAACEDALARLATTQSIEEGEEMLRATYAESLLAMGGREKDADEAIRTAYECVFRRAKQLANQEHRDAYLSRLYECRRIIDMAVERLGMLPPTVASAFPAPLVPRHSVPPAPLRVETTSGMPADDEKK